MTQKKPNPAGQCDGSQPLNTIFTDHRKACLAVLNAGINLSRKQGEFLGGVGNSDGRLTEKQSHWLNALLDIAELPEFDGGDGR
jgi:hypothetical protein